VATTRTRTSPASAPGVISKASMQDESLRPRRHPASGGPSAAQCTPWSRAGGDLKQASRLDGSRRAPQVAERRHTHHSLAIHQRTDRATLQSRARTASTELRMPVPYLRTPSCRSYSPPRRSAGERQVREVRASDLLDSNSQRRGA
jgi:hypothetical protein